MLLNNLSVAILVPMALAATPLGGGRWKKANPSLNPQQCAGGQIKGDTFHLPPKANGQNVGSGCHNGHLRAEYGSKDHYTWRTPVYWQIHHQLFRGRSNLSNKQSGTKVHGSCWLRITLEIYTALEAEG
ncbi:hypothetical protein H9Q72_002564 [Fusarium xylarioides]|uniref:Uncharacterized protein n=1 Tax=Fusarium xylarioides TaxID=221167 RepID=A0A9P7HZL2_9HYPO|nr:hypothetical protein H9Q72_002564 [Fusarium xylarioides]